FVAPTNGAVFNLTDNIFGGVAINVGANARIGGLTMSGNTYNGTAGDSAAIRVSAGDDSYLLTGDRTLDHGIVFAAANSSINSAIAAAETDDTVYVGAGTYAETVNIDRSISLTGDSQAGTIIAGGVRINSHTAPGLLIDGVDISNLTINAGNGQVGLIALSNSADNQFNTTNLTVTNVTINGANQHAVGLFDVSGVTFDNVTINAASGFNAIEAIGLNDFTMTGGAIHGGRIGVNVWSLAGY